MYQIWYIDHMHTIRLGSQLRAARLQNGITQAGLAERVGTSRPQINRLEHGRQEAGLETWERAFKALGLTLSIGIASAETNAHRIHELRSRIFHSIIAEKARRDPRIIEAARARVASWDHDSGPTHPHWIAAWKHLLGQHNDAIIDALSRDDEEMRDLRQSTPFAGALTEEERLGVIRALPSVDALAGVL